MTFQAESPTAPELSAQPQLAVLRAGIFFCDHMRVSSLCATIQELGHSVYPTRDQFQQVLCHHKLPRTGLERSRPCSGHCAGMLPAGFGLTKISSGGRVGAGAGYAGPKDQLHLIGTPRSGFSRITSSKKMRLRQNNPALGGIHVEPSVICTGPTLKFPQQKPRCAILNMPLCNGEQTGQNPTC